MMDREDLDREDFRKNLTNLFVQFADWPCKAKFKYITANRFVESSELEDSLKSKHDSHTNYLVTSIKLSHTDDNGHILINFKFDEKGKTDEEINIAYSNFLGFIIMTFYVIEDEFCRNGRRKTKPDQYREGNRSQPWPTKCSRKSRKM